MCGVPAYPDWPTVKAVAWDILMNDREARRLRAAVGTGRLIVHALERAYQENLKNTEAGAATTRAAMGGVPRRAANLLEAALPGSGYGHATGMATLDLARETGCSWRSGPGRTPAAASSGRGHAGRAGCTRRNKPTAHGSSSSYCGWNS